MEEEVVGHQEGAQQRDSLVEPRFWGFFSFSSFHGLVAPALACVPHFTLHSPRPAQAFVCKGARVPHSPGAGPTPASQPKPPKARAKGPAKPKCKPPPLRLGGPPTASHLADVCARHGRHQKAPQHLRRRHLRDRVHPEERANLVRGGLICDF